MNPFATHRSAQVPLRIALAGALLQAVAAGAAPLPEPNLRLTPIIERRGSADADERALLRVEWKAAQSRADEQDLVGDIIGRVNRMDGTVLEIRRLVETWPAAAGAMSPPPAPAPMRQGGAAPVDDGNGGNAPAPSPYAAMAAALALVFLSWLLAKRHAYLKSQRRRLARIAVTPPQTPSETASPKGPDRLPLEPRPSPQPAMTAALATPGGTSDPGEGHAAMVRTTAADNLTPRAVAATEPHDFHSLAFETITDYGRNAAATSAAPSPMAGLDTGQALELADIMLSMGLAHGAAQALTDHIRQNPRRALYHWLKLLDVYRRSDMRNEFDHAAQELREYFNVEAESWSPEGDSAHSLQDYPHLVERLHALWPTPECAAFLSGLLEDNRGGTRDGFPRAVAEEILLLQRILAII